MKQFLHFTIVLLFVMLLAGCNVQTVAPMAEARQGVCQALNSLRSAAAGLIEIDRETSVAQLQEMRRNVARLVEAARAANTVLQNQQITEMVNAFEEFSRTVDGLTPDQRVGDAAVGLQTSARQVVSALDQAHQTLQCAH
ncbi:MAG: hypothetical protein ACK47M_24070 [Caldilinea sp.]